MEIFSFRLLDSRGMVVQLRVPLLTSIGHDLLNALCGAKPVKWIGKNSHHKIILMDKVLKSKVLSICDNCKGDVNMSVFRDFINQQPIDYHIAFIRLGTLPIVDDNFMNYAMHLVKCENMLSKYDIVEFGPTKVYTGEPVFKKRVCRFCGRSNPEVKFKDGNAHAIPDALGNKNVFCYDECVECNNKLAPIEKQLIDYLNYRRSDNGIKNKRKKIVHVTGHNFDFDGTTHALKITKYAILKETKDQYFVKLEGAEEISHLGIYRALCKIAIDLIPRDLVNGYNTAIRWIKGEITPANVPDVIYCYHNDFVTQPIAKIYIRKDTENIGVCPHILVSLRIMDLTFVYVIPFGKDTYNLSNEQIYAHLKCLFPEDATAYEHIDMDDRIGKFAHVTEWIDKSDCTIIEQEELDNVQERNPNRVEFPVFKSTHVKILSNIIRRYCLCNKNDLCSTSEIKDCCISSHSTEFVFPKEQNTIGLKWSVSVESLHGEGILFSACGSIVARLKNVEEVANMAANELSCFFTEYMLNQAFSKLKEVADQSIPHFDFSQLADLFMQSTGRIMHPRTDTSKTSMTPYLDVIRSRH